MIYVLLIFQAALVLGIVLFTLSFLITSLAETCFGYWGKVGTDCNVCMRVCPWSHARTFPHRAVISLVVRNKWARRLFSLMDDLFYGDKPKPGSPPPWAGYRID